jgi:hypothetical protein
VIDLGCSDSRWLASFRSRPSRMAVKSFHAASRAPGGCGATAAPVEPAIRVLSGLRCEILGLRAAKPNTVVDVREYALSRIASTDLTNL